MPLSSSMTMSRCADYAAIHSLILHVRSSVSHVTFHSSPSIFDGECYHHVCKSNVKSK